MNIICLTIAESWSAVDLSL